jgi:uncharacterized protein (TIGR00369 family)
VSNIWEEPPRGGVPDPAFWARPGLEQVQGFVDRVAPAPPLYHLTGSRPLAAGPGTATFAMPASPWLQSATGFILGGVLAILADGPLGCSIQTTLPGATPYTTTELSMSYLRPAIPDGRDLVSVGRVVHAGRSLALSEATVADADGRLLAHCTSRCFVFPSLPLPDELPDLPPAAETACDTPDPWQRPVVGSITPEVQWQQRTGLELAQGWVAGELPAPPIHHLTGQCPVQAADGVARFEMPATPWLHSPAGTVEGGMLVMLADAALATAVQTTVPAGVAFAPVDITVKFVRPVVGDGSTLTAEGRVVHRGRTMAVAVGEVRDAAGKLVCTATSSALVLPGRSMVGAHAVVPEDEAG